MIDATSFDATSNTEDSSQLDADKDVVLAQWNTVNAQLRDEIGEAAFQSWIKPMKIRTVEDGVVHVTVPTRFMQDWVRQHYSDRLKTLWRAANKLVRTIEVVLHDTTRVLSRPTALA